MRRLSKTKLYMMLGLLVLGIILIVINIINIIFISLGGTFITMAVVLLMLDCGPCIWHWWIPFRMGYHVKLPIKIYMEDGGEIDEWLKNNIKFKFMHRNNDDEIFYFWCNADAIGFKLRWI